MRMPKGDNNQRVGVIKMLFGFSHLAATRTTIAALTSFSVTVVAVTCNRAVKEIVTVCNTSKLKDTLLNSD